MQPRFVSLESVLIYENQFTVELITLIWKCNKQHGIVIFCTYKRRKWGVDVLPLAYWVGLGARVMLGAISQQLKLFWWLTLWLCINVTPSRVLLLQGGPGSGGGHPAAYTEGTILKWIDSQFFLAFFFLPSLSLSRSRNLSDLLSAFGHAVQMLLMVT